MMNYHEMTMNEPRNSPARRQQYLVICTIMAAAFAHSLITSGGLSPLTIQEGIFPGGNFIHKISQRDPAATTGLWEDVAIDLNITTRQYSDFVYALYLDDPMATTANRVRFATGVIVDQSPSGKRYQQLIMELNAKNHDKQHQQQNLKTPSDDDAHHQREQFRLLPYEMNTGDLPSVDAAVLQFPYTGGFVSALITSYRIIPALRRYAMEKGEADNIPLVLSTCSPKQQMCTHYAPLVQGKDFLLGQMDPQSYQDMITKEDEHGIMTFIDWKGVMKDVQTLLLPLQKFISYFLSNK